MSDTDHERIWLQNAQDAKLQDEGRLWCQDKVWPDDPEEGEPTGYIRADLYAASESTVASLRAEVERLTRGRDEAEKSDMSARDMLNDLESEVERLTRERDTYQWADQKHSAQLVEATELVDALRAEVERLTKALSNLRNEIKGAWSLEEHELRSLLGNTNYNCVQARLEDAAHALDRSPSVEPGK